MKERDLTPHDIEIFMRSHPIITIEESGGYRIGEVNGIEFSGKTLTIYIKTLIEIVPARKPEKWIWLPVENTRIDDTKVICQYPKLISLAEELIVRSLGRKITLSLQGKDRVNYLSLMDRYGKKSG